MSSTSLIQKGCKFVFNIQSQKVRGKEVREFEKGLRIVQKKKSLKVVCQQEVWKWRVSLIIMGKLVGETSCYGVSRGEGRERATILTGL